jgi:ABC-type dipeptide/oligopeptide/nickel transport system permease subunit
MSSETRGISDSHAGNAPAEPGVSARAEEYGAAFGAAFLAEQATIKPTSLSREAFYRFRQNRLALASLVVLLILLLLAVFANLLPLQSPTTHPMGADFVVDGGPSSAHWLGTDANGFDLFSRLIYGMRPSFAVGIIGQVITTILGVLFGVVAGFYGGWIDSLLARVTDLIFAFPSFLLAFLVVALFGPQYGQLLGGSGIVVLITIVFALVGWPFLMRFVRGLTLSLREQQFIEAARTVGTPNWKIITKHILPSVWGLVMVQTTFGVGAYIGNEAVLSLLGLGVQKPNADLGVMVAEGINNLSLNAVEAIAPSVLLTVIIVAFAFLGDGLRDAIDPRSNE